MPNIEYLSVAQTAKLVRRELKKQFPGVKFSVRSKKYSGGASINVNWADGPLSKEVDAVVKPYEGGGFDGMIDMAWHRTHYLRADGSVLVHHDPGTEGSRGLHPSQDNVAFEDIMPDDVRVVQFGADYIFTSRARTNQDELVNEALGFLYDHCVLEQPVHNIPHMDRFGNRWVLDIAGSMVREQREGESMADVFKRI